jgi:hypothetical protein
MRQARLHRGIDRTNLYSSNLRQSNRLSPAALRAGGPLATVCLFFGIALAAFVPGSLEQRTGNFFLFGLIPAVGFYAGGHILGWLLMFISELCEMIVVRCFRCVMHLISDLISWAAPRVSISLAKLLALRQKASRSVHRRYWRVRTAIFDFACLLIRSAARFILRLQGFRPLKSGR